MHPKALCEDSAKILSRFHTLLFFSLSLLLEFQFPGKDNVHGSSPPYFKGTPKNFWPKILGVT